MIDDVDLIVEQPTNRAVRSSWLMLTSLKERQCFARALLFSYLFGRVRNSEWLYTKASCQCQYRKFWIQLFQWATPINYYYSWRCEINVIWHPISMPISKKTRRKKSQFAYQMHLQCNARILSTTSMSMDLIFLVATTSTSAIKPHACTQIIRHWQPMPHWTDEVV